MAPFFDSALLLLDKLPEHLAKCFRRLPYNTFQRHFGINTTWYLHSHFEWHKLSNSSIQFLLEVCLAAHDSESLGGLPKMSHFYRLPG
jgi:hypothetical protein